MTKYFTLILLIIGLSSNCQDKYEFDYEIIDHIAESNKIIEFIKNFYSTSIPEDLENFIIFPNFLVPHQLHSMNSKIIPLGITDTSITSGFGSFELIKEGLKEAGCNDPLHLYRVKADLDKNWRDSVMTEYSNINDFFFSFKENRIDYLNYFIELYQLPINFSNKVIVFTSENLSTHLKAILSPTYENDTINKNVRGAVRGTRRDQIVVKTIEICKINGEYKVFSVGTTLQ